LEQLDYLEDLNRLLFSNVVDQAAQKTENYLAYYIGGGINKLAAAAKSLAYISLLKHLLSATDVHRHVFDGSNDTNEIGGDFHKSPMNYMVHQAWTSCATLAHLFFSPKINIAASENRHVGCNSLSFCPLLVPNIFIKKQFPNNRATLASMP
jgi:hypothetical protein